MNENDKMLVMELLKMRERERNVLFNDALHILFTVI